MKKTIKLNLEENIILMLNQLANELHTTKSSIIEKALNTFYKQQKENDLSKFAGILDSKEADKILSEIKANKNTKEFTI